MKKQSTIKIIYATGSLILIGLCVAFCIFSRCDKVEKRGNRTAIEEPSQDEKEPDKQPPSDKTKDVKENGAAQIAKIEKDDDSAAPADPYQKLEKTLADRKGTAAYHSYIFRVREDAGSAAIRRLEAAEGITPLAYTDYAYRADSLDAIRAAVDTAEIEQIEPNYVVKLCDDAQISSSSSPNDPEYQNGEQYNIDHLNIPAVWTQGMEGQDQDSNCDLDHNGDPSDDDIIVAVIDTGYKPGHQDMDADRILDGVNFAEGATDSIDIEGHGTFIAGLITAVKDNGLGIAGICQSIKVLPIRVFKGRTCEDSIVAQAVNYAAEQREIFDDPEQTGGMDISVISMSLGSDEPNDEVERACERAKAAGIILVCSAGNDGDTKPSYPAQYTMGVGSTGPTDKASHFTQRLAEENGVGYANKVWVTAPGESIRSIGLETSAYTYKSGTSFSAPEVAALAALCKSIRNDYDQDEFMELLRESAIPADSTSGKIDGQDIQYGWGKVDFEMTIREINKAPEAEPRDLTFSVRNEAGSVIAGVDVATAVTVTDIAAGQTVEGSDGHWAVTPGKKYSYSVTAPEPYADTTGVFRAAYEDRQMTVVLTGGSYAVGIEITDQDGGEVASETMEVKIVSKNGTVYQKEDDGYYYLANGKYRCEIKDEDIIDTVWTFIIDDQALGWQGEPVHKRFTVRKDRLTVRVMNRGSAIRETDLFVARMLKNRTSRTVKAIDASGAGAKTLTASGILMSDVIRQAGAAACLQKITVEAVDTEGSGDVRRIEIFGDSADRAMIALVEDPEGRAVRMEEGNYMRLIIDGASTADWVYAPYLVTVNGADYHTWGAWRTTREATAAVTGERTRICSACGSKETQTVARKALDQVRGLDTAGQYAKRRFTVSYNACAGATDYQISWRQIGKSAWKSKWSGGKCSAVIKGLKAGKRYEIKVRACRSSDGAYGEYSDSAYRLMSTTGASARAGKKRVRVRWKKAPGAGQYQVWYATNKRFANAKVITLGSKKRSYTIRGLKSKKRYYVRVRPIKRSGMTYTGIYSAAKRVKTR